MPSSRSICMCTLLNCCIRISSERTLVCENYSLSEGEGMSDVLRVAVVGGGIGGLSAAIALKQAGLDVAVYEQAAALDEVGAGVGMAPNGMRMYDRLGLHDAVEAVGARYAEGSHYFRADGELIGDMTN